MLLRAHACRHGYLLACSRAVSGLAGPAPTGGRSGRQQRLPPHPPLAGVVVCPVHELAAARRLHAIALDLLMCPQGEKGRAARLRARGPRVPTLQALAGGRRTLQVNVDAELRAFKSSTGCASGTRHHEKGARQHAAVFAASNRRNTGLLLHQQHRRWTGAAAESVPCPARAFGCVPALLCACKCICIPPQRCWDAGGTLLLRTGCRRRRLCAHSLAGAVCG